MNPVHSADFERIRSLPRRDLDKIEAADWAGTLTPLYALQEGACLLPWQGLCLAEAFSNDGAWIALPVGHGKTLISWLLPTVLGAERTLLIVPGSLVQKTYSTFREFQGVWVAPPPIRIESRQKLSVVSGEKLLDEYRPDLIVLDESDILAIRSEPGLGRSAVPGSAVRRLDRYICAHGDHVRVVAMTGTPARKSLMGYRHILLWCLGDKAPVPLDDDVADSWARALDYYRGPRPSPGVLGPDLRSAREWYKERLRQTPGVIVVDEDSCKAPITVRARYAQEDPVLDDAFARLLLDLETPDGEPVLDPLSRWRVEGQLGIGLYSRWNPPPPDEWREALRSFNKFVRDRIIRSTWTDRPLDSMAHVIRHFVDAGPVQDWVAVKDTFDGETETVWVSDSGLLSCLDWLTELDDPGIVWTGSADFGERLSDLTGLRFFRNQGLDKHGCSLVDVPEKDRPIIVSWHAGKQGFNLQDWPRALVVLPPQSSKWLEQLIGRSHRYGQDRRVIVDVLVTSGFTIDLMDTVIGEAEKVRETESLTQKILRADFVRPKRKELTPSNRYRWGARK